jgi:quinol monooxygenase YgiN
MIVLRFKVTCQPDKTADALEAFRAVVAPSRKLDGVVHFDIAQDVNDPNTIIAVEVFESDDARQAQESLSEVGAVMALLPTALAAPPEATLYRVASSEDAM